MRLNNITAVILLIAIFILNACATRGGEPPLQAAGSDEDWIATVQALAGEMRLDMNAAERKTLAVLDFSTADGYAGFAKSLNEELTAAFRAAGIRVVERDAIDAVMKEQAFQLSGNVDDNTAKSIGKIIGVDMLCYGRIADFPGFVRVSCRIIEVESGELLSIRNIELAKTPRLLAYLSGGSQPPTGQNARPQQNTPQKQSPAIAPNTTAAAIPENRPMLDVSGNDLETEAGQTAAVRAFIPFVVDNLWDIGIVSVEPLGNSKEKPDAYSVKLAWEYKEKFETVRAMADFYRRFPAANRAYATTSDFTYYPTPYANRAERIAFEMFPNARRLLTGREYLTWEVSFVLFDKDGLPIDRYSDTIRLGSSSGTNLGKLGRTREHTFKMSRAAYENMDTVRITRIRGGIPQYDGSYLYK